MSFLTKRLFFISLLAVFVQQAAAQMPRMELTLGFFRIEAEVAANNENRMQGLMYRKTMPANQGMLFVFPGIGQHCMWMKNTDLPLSVAFLDRNGQIINIENMQPHTENSHCAASPAVYALEMNLGWFKNQKIKVGDKLIGIQNLPQAL